MFKNYITISFRNLKRNLIFSSINIVGLSIGLACTLLIGVWVSQELSYDRHFKDSEKIYRVGVNFFNIGNMAIGPEILQSRLREYPEIVATTDIGNVGTLEFKKDGQSVHIENVFRADDEFFDVFSYRFLEGTPNFALTEPNSAVISISTAIKLFGTERAVGKIIERMDTEQAYKVTGVVKIEGKTHLPVQMWISKEESEQELTWTSASSYIYAKIDHDDPKVRLDEILSRLQDEIRSVFAPENTLEEFVTAGTYVFLPLCIEDIHLHSDLRFEPSPVGNNLMVKVFAGVALLILTLACINYINMSTANATNRAREVGVRKSLGSLSSDLIFQFVMESILVCLLATTIALAMGHLFLLGFETLTGMELLDTLITGPAVIVIVYSFALILGVLSGAYPAYYITRFKTVKALKGRLTTDESGSVRNGLVLFQFSISIGLLIVAAFIFNQIRFMENMDKGFESDNVLVVNTVSKIPEHAEYLKKEFQRKSYVNSVSLNERMPASSYTAVTSLFSEDNQEVWTQQFMGDENMVECLGFKLKEGRGFSEQSVGRDTSSIILNEAAVRQLGLEDPIGATINNDRFTVIGVVYNFNYESLKKEISPALLRYSGKGINNLAIKFKGAASEQLIQDLEALWSDLDTGQPLSYYFLDESYQKMVAREKLLSKAILLFTCLAMFISCLGLYGLSIFAARRRAKEISIRRVFGASISGVVFLMSRSFVRPIAIGFFISSPIAYLIVEKWLQNYVYRVDISATPFLFAGFVAIILGLFTVFGQSLEAALRNPAATLRNE